VRTTRRQVIIGSAVLGTAAIVLGGTLVTFFGSTAPAPAESVPTSDLMQPGPLGEQALGPETAPVTIIEYASMTCPHCANFAVNVLPKLKERYIDTGKVRFIFREFPFDNLAAAGFMLARCSDKDKYFPMIEALFQQQSKWVVKVLEGIEWVKDRGEQKFKVNATPTFFINGEQHRGEMTLEDMEKAIQPYLKA
jgi:protein-disulfide isomerase